MKKIFYFFLLLIYLNITSENKFLSESKRIILENIPILQENEIIKIPKSNITYELDFKNKKGIFIMIYPIEDEFYGKNSFKIYRGNETIIRPLQSYLIERRFIKKINDEKVYIEFSVDSKKEGLKYAIHYISMDENEYLNYNLKSNINYANLNKSNNIDYLSWNPYINKNYKVKYSLYFLDYYISDGDFIFNKYLPNETFISNNENIINYSLENLAKKDRIFYIGIKAECLEGVNIIDIYQTVPYNPEPYHPYGPWEKLIELFQYILKIIFIGKMIDEIIIVVGGIILIIYLLIYFFK